MKQTNFAFYLVDKWSAKTVTTSWCTACLACGWLVDFWFLLCNFLIFLSLWPSLLCWYHCSLQVAICIGIYSFCCLERVMMFESVGALILYRSPLFFFNLKDFNSNLVFQEKNQWKSISWIAYGLNVTLIEMIMTISRETFKIDSLEQFTSTIYFPWPWY